MPDIEYNYGTLAEINAEIAEVRERLANSTSQAQVASNEADLADLDLVRRTIIAQERRRTESK